MKSLSILGILAASFPASLIAVVPSFTAPAQHLGVVQDADARRADYYRRVDEVLEWNAHRRANPSDPSRNGLDTVIGMLALHEDANVCSSKVIEIMKQPGDGPFWMLPAVCIAYLGRDQLSAEAKRVLRNDWRSLIQYRGDTENHFTLYYTSLYLMSQLYPDEPGSSWYTGKSSRANLIEARGYLINWMNISTTIGQGEFNSPTYIAEYAIPMLFLATWAKDPAMRQRARMTLDWSFADLAAHTLNGQLGAPNARTSDGAVIEHWNSQASFYSWLLFGNTPPNAQYGRIFGVLFAAEAKNYELPEVIYRIAVDRDGDYVQHDLKRTRRRWRNSEVLMAPVYKTTYMRRDYTVGSCQGGLLDPIQSHAWDVTWAVPDPRGVHNTMFSIHPTVSSYDMQMYFAELPDALIEDLIPGNKPTYELPGKFLGSSRFERVFQDLDTVVALYDIPPGTLYPHINGFFSKNLVNFTEDKSGWIFAQGGNTYLAYRPLAPYALRLTANGDTRLFSPHLKNGTILQAASASEFKGFGAFKAAINALPLKFKLEPEPTVMLRTLRGKNIVVTYGQDPIVNGVAVDYSKWKLFEGPYLNAERGSRKLTITHGRLCRVLDFNTLTVSDSVITGNEKKPPM